MNKKKKSTNTSPYPDEVIDRLARAFYPAILACWNSEEGQREFAAWQAEQAHHTTNKEKQSVPDCWVSVKQFSKNDTATACQDWLRSTRPGRGSIKSHVHTAKVLAWGFLHIGGCTPLARCNTLDFVPKSCAKGAAPLGIPAHIACGRCGFAAQKALTKAYPAVCGEEKALLRKCNNPL